MSAGDLASGKSDLVVAWVKELRIHQWLKNLLLFAPILAAHQEANGAKIAKLLEAFVAFGLVASSVYVTNDLVDLDSDRKHPRKSSRGFASGKLAATSGFIVAPLLLILGLGLAAVVGANFLGWVLVYLVTTLAYSFALKRIALVDCLTLASLYVIRIIAGAAVTNIPLSFWLLAFSIFLFLSLAFVKRFAELHTLRDTPQTGLNGRDYSQSDEGLVQLLGVSSGFAAALVLGLYVNTDTVRQLYKSPEVVWGLVPVLIYWISFIWLKANRGEMNDDPLVFAVKDRASLMSGAIFATILYIGTVGWPW
ncbi:MAG: UbiA family prenyltransferase [Actinomycetes bacterium]